MEKDELYSKKEHMASLYDVYQNLLTEKQRTYFESYYFDDLSLGEIALENGISRNAVFVSLKAICTSLDTYEEKLGILKIKNKINDIIVKHENAKSEEVKEIIKELINIEME